MKIHILYLNIIRSFEGWGDSRLGTLHVRQQDPLSAHPQYAPGILLVLAPSQDGECLGQPGYPNLWELGSMADSSSSNKIKHDQ